MRTRKAHHKHRLVGIVGALTIVGALSTAASATSGDTTPDTTPDTSAGTTAGSAPDGQQSAGRQSEWFNEEQFNRQLAARTATPVGPEGEPWLQSIDPTMVDTSQYAADGPYEVCFSNTDVGNPWRVVGFTTMQQEVLLHPEIATFTVVDAGGSEEKQIADIAELVDRGTCDILIVSPASTAALTPAIEAACQKLPVIVFDRGVETDCPVTFIHPAGGYLFGADAAQFLVDNVPAGGNIVALRILPGVDVLETRWVAGQIIMEEAGLNIIASEFTQGDAATVKSIIQDLIDRGEQIDGVWMDAGATTVAAIEAFQENGLDVPPITGEDQQDFLIKWRDEGLTAVAPTYPTYQWRTPILAALMVLGGEQIPGGEWLLPQPVITSDNLNDFIDETMPPLFYAMCGCQEMPNFPDAWLS